MTKHEDILGTPPKPKGTERQRKALGALAKAVKKKQQEDFTDLVRPMTISQMVDVFRMDRHTIKKRLADLDPVGFRAANQPLYDFRQVLPYLVEPKLDYKRIIADMNPADLPVNLQKDFWASRRAEQQYRKEAAELWHTADIERVFGLAAGRFTQGVTQMIAQVEAATGLSEEQRGIVTDLTDGLLQQLQRSLAAFPDDSTTESAEADLDGQVDK